MSTESPGVRLGDLLTSAGLLKVDALRAAMLTAKQQGLPVGRILITSGYLTENQLQAAVQAQSLLKDDLVEMHIVLKALGIIAQEQMSLEQAMTKCGWQKPTGAISNKLGELVLEAQIVTKEDLTHALSQCENIGLPLGRMLVLTGSLSEQMLSNALNAQVLIRDKKITRAQALKGLKAAQQRQLPLEKALDESDFLQLPSSTSIRLGELLTDAGLIDQANLMNAVELGLLQDKLIGQVLRQMNLLTESDLAAALELQKLVTAGSVRRPDAIEMLTQCHAEKSNINDVLKRKQPRLAQTVEEKGELFLDGFLKIAGIINQADIDKAIKIGSQDSDIFGKMLLSAGVMEEQMVEASLDAYALVSDNTLTMDQAMIALKNCRAKRHSLESAFKDLGWSADSEGEEESTAPPPPPAEPEVKPAAAIEAAHQGNNGTGSPALTGMDAQSNQKETTRMPSPAERPKTGAWSTPQETNAPAASAAPIGSTTAPVTPTSGAVAMANLGTSTTQNPRITSEFPVISPVVSKRAGGSPTTEFERPATTPDAQASSAPASNAPPVVKPVTSRQTGTQAAVDLPSPPPVPILPIGSPAKNSDLDDPELPSWLSATPTRSSMSAQPPKLAEPQAPEASQTADFANIDADQFMPTDPEPPAPRESGSDKFAPLKTAPPTRRSSQWLEAIEQPAADRESAPPAMMPPPMPSSVPPPVQEPAIAPQSPQANEQQTAQLRDSGSQAVPGQSGWGFGSQQPPKNNPWEMIEDDTRSTSGQFAEQPAPPKSSLPRLGSSSFFSGPVYVDPQNPILPPAPSAEEAAPTPVPVPIPPPAASPAPVAPATPVASIPPVIPVAQSAPAEAEQPPAQSQYDIFRPTMPDFQASQYAHVLQAAQAMKEQNAAAQAAQAPAADPWYNIPSEPAQAQQPATPQVPSIDDMFPSSSNFSAPEPIPPAAPTFEQSPPQPAQAPPAPPLQGAQPAQSAQPALGFSGFPADAPQTDANGGGWGVQQQKVPPPNPWAAAIQRSASGTTYTAVTDEQLAEATAPPPAPPPAQAPAQQVQTSQSGVNNAAPGWNAPAEPAPAENPWTATTGTAQAGGQQQLASFADNPGWQPPAPAAPPPPPPQPKPAPPPQVPAAAAEDNSWEYSANEAAKPAPPKTKGLNAFMPKGKKDK